MKDFKSTKWDVRNWPPARKAASQEHCFKLGYSWYCFGTTPSNLTAAYYVITGRGVLKAPNWITFKNSETTECYYEDMFPVIAPVDPAKKKSTQGHNWCTEICAWANGRVIEQSVAGKNEWSIPSIYDWNDPLLEFRIQPIFEKRWIVLTQSEVINDFSDNLALFLSKEDAEDGCDLGCNQIIEIEVEIPYV